MKPGDTVFVSGAAGAVGSLAGQIAKLLGAGRVIGSAGSPAKVARCSTLGFDAAFDYHDGPVRDAAAAAAPDGIDVYFDNVGGEHLEAAIGAMNQDGRIALCGAIAQYNATEPPAAPRNLAAGDRTSSSPCAASCVGSPATSPPEFRDRHDAAGWATARIQFDETVVDGLENAPAAFIGLMRGENTGKMVVIL